MIFAASLWQDGQTASGIPLLRMLDPDRSMSSRGLSSSGMRLVSPTNPQMVSGNYDFTIGLSPKPRPAASPHEGAAVTH